MTYLITGATGFIGREITNNLLAAGHNVIYLGRKRGKQMDSRASFYLWNIEQDAPLDSVPRLDVVIHLAGEPTNQRWTEEVKKRIYSSRIDGTRNLVSALSKLRHKPEVLVSSSAIGYYGDRGDEILTEQSAPGSNFLAKVCVDWEVEATRARQFGIRVVPIRTATVLGRDGGAFPLLKRPASFGLAATFGDGKQWMSWIHKSDLIDLMLFASKNSAVTTVLNGASPQPVTNTELTKALAKSLHRPAFLSVPQFALRFGLGEMSEFLFDSLRVLPAAAEHAGFQYQFKTIDAAFADLTR